MFPSTACSNKPTIFILVRDFSIYSSILKLAMFHIRCHVSFLGNLPLFTLQLGESSARNNLILSFCVSAQRIDYKSCMREKQLSLCFLDPYSLYHAQ